MMLFEQRCNFIDTFARRFFTPSCSNELHEIRAQMPQLCDFPRFTDLHVQSAILYAPKLVSQPQHGGANALQRDVVRVSTITAQYSPKTVPDTHSNTDSVRLLRSSVCPSDNCDCAPLHVNDTAATVLAFCVTFVTQVWHHWGHTAALAKNATRNDSKVFSFR